MLADDTIEEDVVRAVEKEEGNVSNGRACIFVYVLFSFVLICSCQVYIGDIVRLIELFLFSQTTDEKYDALKDKLLFDALMKQMGEADWLRLSEKERQQKLMELKKRARELQREGTGNGAGFELIEVYCSKITHFSCCPWKHFPMSLGGRNAKIDHSGEQY